MRVIDFALRPEKRQPDVVLMDTNMPGSIGSQAARRILHAHGDAGVIMATLLQMTGHAQAVAQARQAGAGEQPLILDVPSATAYPRRNSRR